MARNSRRLKAQTLPYRIGDPMELNDQERAAVESTLSLLSGKLQVAEDRKDMGCVADCALYLRLLLGPRVTESFVVLYLDARHKLIEKEEHSAGSVDQTNCYPRAIIQRSLANCARYIVVAHNHPSGAISPSNADIDSTRRLAEACEPFDVELLEHFVVGRAPGFPAHAILLDEDFR